MADEGGAPGEAEVTAESASEAPELVGPEEVEVGVPVKSQSEPLMGESPSGDRDAFSRTMSNEEARRMSESAELKEEEALKRRSKQGKSSSLGAGERRASAYRTEDSRKSRLRTALGSIIDIRRSSVGGEISDKKVVRYMNTYKLESDNPFNPEKVDKILEAVMVEALENLTYDTDKCPKQAKWASMAIKAKVKALEFDRYKIISIVTIGEKHSQDVLVTCRFLWDAEKDRYSTFAMENTYVFGIAQCFGLYYE